MTEARDAAINNVADAIEAQTSKLDEVCSSLSRVQTAVAVDQAERKKYRTVLATIAFVLLIVFGSLNAYGTLVLAPTRSGDIRDLIRKTEISDDDAAKLEAEHQRQLQNQRTIQDVLDAIAKGEQPTVPTTTKP